MSKTPAISILTPVWNGLPYIKETVESVLSQNFQDWEMIISDNASTDGTSEYLASLTDPRIKFYRHEVNKGVYNNLTFCFSKATAEIFMGLCADDYFCGPDALEHVVKTWQAAGHRPAFISFNWKNRQINHDALMKFSYDLLPRSLSGAKSTIAYFLFGNIPGNFSEMSGRVAVVQNQRYIDNARFSADFEFWMRLSKEGGIEFDNKDVVYIRRHDRVAATYMLTKGEYHVESAGIYQNLINDLSVQYDRKALVDYYNVVICSFHLRAAIKAAAHGKFAAIKSFLRMRSPIFWPTGFQVLGCLPFAVSNGLRSRVSIAMARKIWNSGGLASSKEGRPAPAAGHTSIHA